MGGSTNFDFIAHHKMILVISILCISLSNAHRPSYPAPQPPGPRAIINPAICTGITGLLVGIGIGIGFGALIFNPFRSGRVGGGLWFGKKRRKRSMISDEDIVDDQGNIIEVIDDERHRYDEDDEDNDFP